MKVRFAKSDATNRKNSINGISTRNHDILGAPAIHIKFNIHVHNKIYINLITKIKKVLGTSHE